MGAPALGIDTGRDQLYKSLTLGLSADTPSAFGGGSSCAPATQ